MSLITKSIPILPQLCLRATFAINIAPRAPLLWKYPIPTGDRGVGILIMIAELARELSRPLAVLSLKLRFLPQKSCFWPCTATHVLAPHQAPAPRAPSQ